MRKDDIEVEKAKCDIMKSGIVPCVLHYLRCGSQSIYKRLYWKQQGLVWQLILLTEFGAELTLEIKNYCKYTIEKAQEKTSGKFTMYYSIKNGGGQIGGVVPCLTRNMVWCMRRLGYVNDDRIARAIKWMTDYSSFNDGTIEGIVHPHNNREAY